MQEFLSFELKDGLSQSERLLPQLIPGNVPIDSRDPASLMLRSARLAAQFNYYNSSNEIDGDWQEFFVADFNILTLMISALDLSKRPAPYLADSLVLLLQKVNALHLPADIASKMSDITSKVTAIHLNSTTAWSDLLIQYNRVQEIAAYYRRNNDWTIQQYPPHLALLITFLQLYGHLRDQINQLTKSHLDYYYRNILNIAPVKEIPDTVHVIFAAEANTNHIHLHAGEELLAEIPGWDEPVKYRLTTDLRVSKAKIASLRTFFIADRPVFADNTDTDTKEQYQVSNRQLYQGNYPSIGPDALVAGATPVPWPLFGEDQDELAIDQRNMVNADIGLLLASPLFYLTEGNRSIRITLHFIASSFSPLDDYLTRFAAASRKTRQAVEYELLSRAFDIHFTASDGWCPAEQYTVRVVADNAIEILIGLSPSANAIAIYQPAIHGPQPGINGSQPTGAQPATPGATLQTSLPVIRLLINNDSPHNALSFFSGLQLERIHLLSQVQQFRQVRMQNNIGNLAAGSAFQPFGPLPAVGSYLDINNSNVFNRYTTDLAVRIEWMDLPKEPGGFATWYAGYNNGVTDESFRIGIGALKNGTVPPAAQQQSYPLYNPNPDDNADGPAPVTWIRNIDMKRLEFTNTPLLAKEELEPEGFFRHGAIRLELLSPPDAYGHVLFPRLFPEVAMQNAQWWRRRRPLPNQPYTPRAKSVSINYTLEHAEAFRDMNDPDGGLELIQQYPFGFRRIFPGSDQRSIPFLPGFDAGGHLHIGLSDVRRGEQLSLLFQLEEKNFHHTLHDTGIVGWSYLQDDEWVTMDGGSILSDTTNGFINTGIVRLKLPAQISLHNTTWPAGLFWLRVSLTGATDMKSKVIAVLPQATIAERRTATTTPDTSPTPNAGPSANTSFLLPPGSITQLVRKIQGLQQVWQPFLSFGGRPVEQDEAYYTRVSERLCHKVRPLTAIDIEQLVLDRFPSIAVVKCFGTNAKRQSVYPGVDLQVILIPKEGADGSSQYNEQPKVNLATLFAVKHYLASFASPFINIEIGNPVYEKIKIAARIRPATLPGGDTTLSDGYYLKTLHDDIRRYLCPWIYSPGSDVKIGTRIYIPELLTFIKRRPYVAEVTGFSVIHFFNIKDPATGELKGALIDSAVVPVEYIQGSVPEAVLIPSDHHLFSLLQNGEFIEPNAKGIGDFFIGDELLVSLPELAQREGYDEEPISYEDPDEDFTLTFAHQP